MVSAAKKLLNDASRCVDDCLLGLQAAHPHLAFNAAHRVIINTVPEEHRLVGLVSGGGSGHEPFPAGYVGCGMLTGAVCGSVFASPPSTNILYAIRAVAGLSPGGVLVLIPNYTGDMLNFGLAVQLAKAEGFNVEHLVVGDDIAQSVQGEISRVGRRGMTGLVAVFKMAGAAAQNGQSLQQVKAVAASAVENAATLGLALDGATLPAANAPLFSLGIEEMELGVGVHGEAGIRRMEMLSASEAVSLCLEHIISYLQLTHGAEVVVVVNNLGGLSHMEQWVVVGEVHKQLTCKGISVLRIYAASLFTCLNMPGIQICLLRVPSNLRSMYLSTFDATTSAPSWPGCSLNIPRTSPHRPLPESTPEADYPKKGPKVSAQAAETVQRCLFAATQALKDNELRLNQLDSGCGDGDCGTTLKNLAVGIENKGDDGQLYFSHPYTLALQLAGVAAYSMGGTSGAIYSLLLTEAAEAVLEVTQRGVSLTDGARGWAAVWRAALQGVQKYSTARVGDRTMFDALEPALQVFEQHVDVMAARLALEKAVTAAEEGCEGTKRLTARAGRASYVESIRVTDEDAGAFAVTVWLRAIWQSL